MADSNGNLVSDEYGNALLFSRRREPGKINLNTMSKPAWLAISPGSERVPAEDRLPGTPWDTLQDSRSNVFESYSYDSDGDGEDDSTGYNYKDGLFCYFQPSHTLGLWVQLDGSKAPVPSFTSLLAQQGSDLSESSSSSVVVPPQSSSSVVGPEQSSSSAITAIPVARVAAAPVVSMHGRTLQVNYAGFARVDLFSVTGSAVRTLWDGNAAGSVELGLRGVPAGIYVVRVQTAAGLHMQKIRLQ